MYSRDELARDFAAVGVQAGDAIMLHASVRAVGPVAGGPDQIHLALKQALTPEGTLMMYAGCPDGYDEVGRGNLTPEEELEILEKLPAFDPLTDRAQRDNGTLVEFFRSYPGTQVNRHVTRFAAWGRHAEHLVSEHPWDYAYGRGTPLDRLVKLGGKVLLLGSDHDQVTLLHYAEHIAPITGRRVARFVVPVEVNGVRAWRKMEEFDTAQEVHPNWPDRFFALLVDGYLSSTSNHGGKVGAAQSYLLPAAELVDFALPWMIAIASDASAAGALRLNPPPCR